MNKSFKDYAKKQIRSLKRYVTYKRTLKKESIVKKCGFNEIVWIDDCIWGYECTKTGKVITIIELQKMSFRKLRKLKDEQ